MGRKDTSLPVEVWQQSCRDVVRSSNPCSDVWLNGQKSAEAIVPRQDGGRAEHQEVPETKRIREECQESRQLHLKVETGRWK